MNGGIEGGNTREDEGHARPFIETIVQDLRFALRQLRKNPAFAFTAVMVFALGIGASTAIFAFVDAALVKPLPYQDPSRLVALFERIPVGDRYHLSYGDYLYWKRLNRSFTSLSVYRPDRFMLKTIAGAEEVCVIGRSYVGQGDEASQRGVSPGYFETVGARLLQGRYFTEEDDSTKPRVALINRTMATQILSRQDPLGKSIVNEFYKEHPVRIIGVVDDIKDGPLDTKPSAVVYDALNQDPMNDF